MKYCLLDTSALLALRDDEAGADQVAKLLQQADNGKIKVFGCFITLMEVLYRVWKDESETEARLAYSQCKSLPIEWIHENTQLLEAAANIKANHNLSLADAWIAACALQQDACLVHKDPEFGSVKSLNQQALPYK